MNLETIEKEYQAKKGLYDLLCKEMTTQINELVCAEGIPLASPLEYRVKTWGSIAEKIERNQSNLKILSEMPDVAGIRIIALFRRDLERIATIIESNLDVLHKEDTSSRLAEDQFGYGSIHYLVRPPAAWVKVPTLKKLEGLQAEIQVRTGSQHIWAAVSHALQYKKEAHVPVPLRRAINRAAALLETVDLEFESFLREREEYAKELEARAANQPLNVESLRGLLGEMLPPQNRKPDEDYGELLDDILSLKIGTTGRLRTMIEKHLESAMKNEAAQVRRGTAQLEKGELLTGTTPERIKRGVYYSHVGLARQILRAEFGESIRIGSMRKLPPK